MLMDAMQILAGRDADMSCESFRISGRNLASCPTWAKLRISWMKETRFKSHFGSLLGGCGPRCEQQGPAALSEEDGHDICGRGHREGEPRGTSAAGLPIEMMPISWRSHRPDVPNGVEAAQKPPLPPHDIPQGNTVLAGKRLDAVSEHLFYNTKAETF